MRYRTNLFSSATVIYSLALLPLLAGCDSLRQPAHKPVKKRLAAEKAVAAMARDLAQAGHFTNMETSGATIHDESVRPAMYVLPTFAQRSEQQVAAEALSLIGPPAVPQLVEALRSPDVQVRRQALEVLIRMGPDAKEAVPDLMRLLDDEDEYIRKLASRALGRIGPDAAPAVPALMRTLLQPAPVPPRE